MLPLPVDATEELEEEEQEEADEDNEDEHEDVKNERMDAVDEEGRGGGVGREEVGGENTCTSEWSPISSLSCCSMLSSRSRSLCSLCLSSF